MRILFMLIAALSISCASTRFYEEKLPGENTWKVTSGTLTCSTSNESCGQIFAQDMKGRAEFICDHKPYRLWACERKGAAIFKSYMTCYLKCD